MTPLTHAVVGAAIYQQLRNIRRPRWIWILAFPIAFLSHYFLDAIPHFEGSGPSLTPMERTLVMLVFGILGVVLSVLILRWNRELGTIWLILSIWIGLGPNFYSLFRVLTAALALLAVAWTSDRLGRNPWNDMAYMLAGMVSFSPDLIPSSLRSLKYFHNKIHYRLDWGTAIHLAYSQDPIPHGLLARLHDGYFLMGYALELTVEGGIFFTALYLCTRCGVETRTAAENIEVSDLELSQRS